MLISKLIKELQKYPPEMEVGIFHIPQAVFDEHDTDEDIIETLHPILTVETVDIGCSEPEFISRIGNGNQYLRLC